MKHVLLLLILFQFGCQKDFEVKKIKLYSLSAINSKERFENKNGIELKDEDIKKIENILHNKKKKWELIPYSVPLGIVPIILCTSKIETSDESFFINVIQFKAAYKPFGAPLIQIQKDNVKKFYKFNGEDYVVFVKIMSQYLNYATNDVNLKFDKIDEGNVFFKNGARQDLFNNEKGAFRIKIAKQKGAAAKEPEVE